MNLRIDAAKAIVGLRPSFSTHVRLSERGAPVDSLRKCDDTDSLLQLRCGPHGANATFSMTI
jgi:hypothetical protein